MLQVDRYGNVSLSTSLTAAVAQLYNLSYGMDDQVRFPAETSDFSHLQNIQTGSGAPTRLLFNGYQVHFPQG